METFTYRDDRITVVRKSDTTVVINLPNGTTLSLERIDLEDLLNVLDD